nr:vacuolar protein sorting-associated protein 53 A [Tanacetum cinerariifolium]
MWMWSFLDLSDGWEFEKLAKLDKTERRYAWVKRLLRTNEEIWKIFPTSWHVDYLLCIQFCKLTRTQLEDILENLKEKPDVATLLTALRRTIKFEEELAEKFGGIAAHQGNQDDFNFRGIISSCFEPHLMVYMEFEEKTLMDNLEKLIQEETWEGNDTKVLNSIIQVFMIIKRSLKRCSALTKNQTLLNLFKVFQRVLIAYATKIYMKLPKGGTGIVAAATGMDG